MPSRFRAGVAVMAVALGLLACSSARASVDGWSGLYEASVGAAGRSIQGYLGVDVRDVRDDQVEVLKLKESRGAEVIHVDHDGPAGNAGLHEHDVILQMNGQAIDGEEQLRKMLREAPPGRTVTLVISRDGQQQTVTARMANRLEVERKAWEDHWRVPEPENESGGSQGNSFFSPVPATKTHSFMGSLTLGSAYTGATVETLGPQLAEFFGSQGVGILVHSVDANSPAAQAGLRAGDVVVRANAVKMTSSSDWAKIVRENKGKSLAVVVLRDKKEQTLTLVPDAKKRSSLDLPPLKDGGSYFVVLATRLGLTGK